MKNHKIKVIGVPEHFNLPWRLLAQSDVLESTGLTIAWTDIAEGTGAMIDQLQTGEADVALLLTEGAVAGISKQRGYRIVGEYVSSPLRWGIHVASASVLNHEKDLEGHRFAISRYGSGSHLMANIYAEQQLWPEKPAFCVVNTLGGAVDALTNGDADIFLWEQFTTQPYVDQGVFRRVGVLPTPWPCFVACLSDKSAFSGEIAAAILRAALSIANLLKLQPASRDLFADRYALAPGEVSAWLDQTAWSTNGLLEPSWIRRISDALQKVGSIEQSVSTDDALIPIGDVN
ncbi:MAG: ABC transporter substrate-binding protein [Woeseiaceae bacterium]